MTAEQLVSNLGLVPHPEGGFYKRVFPEDENASSGISTIYYLLENDDFSAFHRLKGLTEIWYWQSGAELDIHIIDRSGTLETHRLSPDACMQVVVEPGQWFAAEIPSREGYVLVGCAVSPSFVYDSFELADRETLMASYPHHREIISRLCR